MDVRKCFSEIFIIRLASRGKLCILGIYPKDFPRALKQTLLLEIRLLQAMRAIALGTISFVGNVDKRAFKLLWIGNMNEHCQDSLT